MSVSSELKTVLDAFDDPRLLVRADHTVAYANRAFVRRYGRQDFAGRSCYELLFIFGLWYFFFSPEHRPEVNADVVGNVVLGAADAPAKANPTK